MPSGRANGPEKRRRTRRDVRAEPRTDTGGEGRLRRNRGRRRYGRRATPWKVSLIEVNIGRDNDAVDANPGAGVHACLGDGGARFDGVRAASEWHDAHDGGLFAGRKLVRSLKAARGARSSIQYVDGVRDSVVPVTRWG
eukprot:252664-Pleurochrysis_carterae.AAC.2